VTGLGTRDCPVGCGRVVEPGKLMCLPCWREVPRDLQQAVNRSWARYRSMIGKQRRTGKLAALQDYQQARDAAIASIR
jgi:hypothetical protein